MLISFNNVAEEIICEAFAGLNLTISVKKCSPYIITMLATIQSFAERFHIRFSLLPQTRFSFALCRSCHDISMAAPANFIYYKKAV